MIKEIWQNVQTDLTDALKITGTGSFEITACEQFETYYQCRVFGYSSDVLKKKFWMILEDNKWMIDVLKKYLTYTKQLTDHLNYAKIIKINGATDSAHINTTAGLGTSQSRNLGNGLVYGKGQNSASNKLKSKGGNTDANSYDDSETTQKYLDVDQTEMPAMRAFTSGAQLTKNEINDISSQLTGTIGKIDSETESKTSNLNKNTLKTDSSTSTYNAAENLLKVLNIKIPELRRNFFKKFEPLFLSVYQ